MNTRSHTSKSTTTLLLAGLATGAAAWYLFGTQNGKRTFTHISDSLKGFSDDVVNKANDTIANLKSRKDNMMS